MVNASITQVATWAIAAAAVGGVIMRPKNWPEAWWAVAGAVLLVAFSLISPAHALSAVAKGLDVYLFLIGMMLLAELARREGVFDWLAGIALKRARGSGRRLFLLVYAVGTLVTIFLSNDATAVVLTPAGYAVAKHARVPALPYLLICAFIANAASFVLPISNPANLVVFGDQMPVLVSWLMQFGPASIVAIVSTYGLLWWTQRKHVRACIATSISAISLSAGGRLAAGSNLINNLPMGLIGATVANAAHLPVEVTGAILVGVDLGPNLSVTGSLATILWLVAIRREGEDVSARRFLSAGARVIPLSLMLTFAALLGIAELRSDL
jgi:arsenical pump membrane protein